MSNTRIYDPTMRRKAANAAPTPGFDFHGLSKGTIDVVLDRVSNRFVSVGMDPTVVICYVIDLSGSMNEHLKMIKELTEKLTVELGQVYSRTYMIEIIVINNDESRLVYFGDIRDLDVKRFLQSLPRPTGYTPYAKALEMGMNLMNELFERMEAKKQYYNPCGVLLTVTDALENSGDTTCAASITKRISEAAANGSKVLTEFVTQSNQKGLVSGGFKVPIDSKNSKDLLERFVCALRAGSSLINGSGNELACPDKRNRVEYDNYLADRLFSEMNNSYETVINPEIVWE